MRTKWSVVALLLGTLVAVACGGGDDAKESKATAAPQVTQAAATQASGTQQAAATAAGTATAQALNANFGAVFTLSGPNAVYGQAQQKGVQLAMEEINGKNAVEGVKVNITVEDDAGDRNQGINVFNKFLGQTNLTAIIGPTLSNTAQATDPIAQEKKVPVLGVSNTAAGITDIGDFIFRDSLTEGDVIPQTIKKVATTVKPKKAALMFANDDAFSKSGGDVMRDALKANGIEIATEQQFSTNDKDFRAQLTAVRGAGVDVIVVSALTAPATAIVTQARDLGLKQPIVGGNGFNTPQLAQNAGDAAEGVIVGAAWNSASTNPKSQDFIKNYKAKFNQDPDQFAAQAYAGVYILAEAVKNAKSTERPQVRDALTKIKDLDTVLGKFSFNEKRDAVHPAVVQQIKGGKFTVLE
jgi:branched-chain amino acid transport system substrate-binding protein